MLLGELALIGAVAGVLGTITAAALVVALSLQTSLVATLLVLPVSVGLALVAGSIPAGSPHGRSRSTQYARRSPKGLAAAAVCADSEVWPR